MPLDDPPFPVPDTDTVTSGGDAAELADWIDAEPLPALEHFRDELRDLADQGQPDTEPVTDRLVEVIRALNETGEALRDSDPGRPDEGLPSSLVAVLARCTDDIVHAQQAVAASQELMDRRAAALARRAAGLRGARRPGDA